MTFIFPSIIYYYIYIYWECHHPNWLSYFFRGVGQPPTRCVLSSLGGGTLMNQLVNLYQWEIDKLTSTKQPGWPTDVNSSAAGKTSRVCHDDWDLPVRPSQAMSSISWQHVINFIEAYWNYGDLYLYPFIPIDISCIILEHPNWIWRGYWISKSFGRPRLKRVWYGLVLSSIFVRKESLPCLVFIQSKVWMYRNKLSHTTYHCFSCHHNSGGLLRLHPSLPWFCLVFGFHFASKTIPWIWQLTIPSSPKRTRCHAPLHAAVGVAGAKPKEAWFD